MFFNLLVFILPLTAGWFLLKKAALSTAGGNGSRPDGLYLFLVLHPLKDPASNATLNWQRELAILTKHQAPSFNPQSPMCTRSALALFNALEHSDIQTSSWDFDLAPHAHFSPGSISSAISNRKYATSQLAKVRPGLRHPSSKKMDSDRHARGKEQADASGDACS